MEYRIENLDFELKIVGKSHLVKTSEAFNQIPTIWSNAEKDGILQELINLSWENPKCKLESILGICGNEAAIKDEEFNYFIGVRYEGETPNEMESITISHNTWAVFPKITEAWTRLYSEWVPTSGYDLANVPCIECYYPPNHEPKNELWVPVIPK